MGAKHWNQKQVSSHLASYYRIFAFINFINVLHFNEMNLGVLRQILCIHSDEVNVYAFGFTALQYQR